jgi:hypothetical protein
MAYFWILSKNVFCILSKNVFCIPGDIPVQMEYLRELGMGRQRGGQIACFLPVCSRTGAHCLGMLYQLLRDFEKVIEYYTHHSVRQLQTRCGRSCGGARRTPTATHVTGGANGLMANAHGAGEGMRDPRIPSISLENFSKAIGCQTQTWRL